MVFHRLRIDHRFHDITAGSGSPSSKRWLLFDVIVES